MLRGFATINYWTDDVQAAKRWYAELLGVEPCWASCTTRTTWRS